MTNRTKMWRHVGLVSGYLHRDIMSLVAAHLMTDWKKGYVL